jgi:uncharacterized membrane protein YqhA
MTWDRILIAIIIGVYLLFVARLSRDERGRKERRR